MFVFVAVVVVVFNVSEREEGVEMGEWDALDRGDVVDESEEMEDCEDM